MDAMPMTFAQELGAWSSQLASAQARIEDALKRLRRLPIGGTAIGTGINADPSFGKAMAKTLSTLSKTKFESAADKFEGLASQDDSVELSGQLSALRSEEHKSELQSLMRSSYAVFCLKKINNYSRILHI